MNKDVTLLEALTGVSFSLVHLDGRVVRVQAKKGDIISPGSQMTCEGLGLPFHKTSYKFGNLFITFNIKFPEQVNQKQIQEFTSILSSQQKSNEEKQRIAGADEQAELIKFEEYHKNTHAQGGTHGNDSEEEDDG